MGQSTDAYLFYGLCWNDEAELLDDNPDDEWDEIVARREGHTSPWDLYRDSGAEDEHETLPYSERQAAYEAWKRSIGFEDLYNQWSSVRDEIKSRYSGISISSHCSCDYPRPYIDSDESESQARRGSPQQIDPVTLNSAPTDVWDKALDRFVNDLEIDISEAQGPGWFLVSNWC
jgi:hypothetical protein